MGIHWSVGKSSSDNCESPAEFEAVDKGTWNAIFIVFFSHPLHHAITMPETTLNGSVAPKNEGMPIRGGAFSGGR
jgi:hypothetical protein